MSVLQWTGATGLAAVVTCLGATIAGSLLDPSYSQMRQRIGDLTATGASTAPALAPAYAFYNLLVVAFAIGLYLSSTRSSSSKTGMRLLTVNGLCGLTMMTFAPEHSRVHALAPSNAGNLGFAALSMLAMLGGLFAYGSAFREETGWHSLSLFSTAIGGALVGGGAVATVTLVANSPLAGLAERAVIALFTLWLAVTSANALLQAKQTSL